MSESQFNYLWSESSSVNTVNLVKKLLQFRRYRIFLRGLLFFGAPCTFRLVHADPSHFVLLYITVHANIDYRNKWQNCSLCTHVNGAMHARRRGGGKWGGGIPLAIRLGGLGSVLSSPSGGKWIWCILFVIEPLWWKENNLFIDNYSGTNKQINMNQLQVHKSSIIIWDFNAASGQRCVWIVVLYR